MPAAVGLILLAAGGSSRLGRPKQLLRYQGQTLLRRAASAAIASGCSPVIVVLGEVSAECVRELAGLNVEIICNSAWEHGIGTSIRAGLHSLQAAFVDAVVIQLCDQPRVDEIHLRRLVAEFEGSDTAIVATDYGGHTGVPALFARRMFPALAALPDQAGARNVIQSQVGSVVRVPCPEAAIDVDTPEDYRRLTGDNPG